MAARRIRRISIASLPRGCVSPTVSRPRRCALPHGTTSTPETRDGYSRYLAEITYYDGQVGQILGLLDKHGLADNTLVMVTSEQGNSMPFAKWTLYDSGLQTALIARWPGKIAAGAVTGAMVEYVDLVPTFVDAAGGRRTRFWTAKACSPCFSAKVRNTRSTSTAS